ncbi:hypothetical protein AHiyo1_52480, partial [Arthrobacter sp. Hiyo1]
MNSPQLSQTHTVRGSYVDGGWRQSAGGIRSINCP